MITNKKILIVGVGNSIQMDDGVGIHTINELKKYDLPRNVKLFDGGTLGVDLMPWLEGNDHVIFIDSVDANENPGTIFKFKPDDINYESAPKTSVHQIGLIEAIQMIKLIGKAPSEITIFGIQPKTIDWGENLTEPVENSIPKVIKHVLAEIENSLKELNNPLMEEENG
ncbi:MAG: HyaD/HybD family hydrogenase maturation endopeptidase [Melioribacteraceae bacterium]|nr:HyaD/HybD family hydrogenase maturation endopeptidase [Melioribacteraceae bacterium]MCF8265455.1 HyaD/HybD family hydrogenase maturation endopeptidase [Melioribacteraceae bacterium]